MVFNTLSQTFSFHSSPDAFISDRLESLAISDPDALPSPSSPNKIVIASLLNRKVHVVSSYQLCRDIMEASSSADPSTLAACRCASPAVKQPSSSLLSSSSASLSSFASSFSFGGVNKNKDRRGGGGGKEEKEQSAGTASSAPKLKPDTFVAGPAYDQLMADFFPAPNILLQDGPDHAKNKRAWQSQLADVSADTASRVREIAEKHIATTFLKNAAAEGTAATSDRNGQTNIDLYHVLKSLSWEILLGIVLDVSPSDPSKSTEDGKDNMAEADFAEIESLQETLLRGQFSLFPVAFNTGVWQSPRSKGIQARKDLQARLKQIVAEKRKQATKTGSGTDMRRCPLLKADKVSDDEAASHALLFTSSIAVKALASLLLAMTMNLFLWRSPSSRQGTSSDSKTIEEVNPDPTKSLAEFIRSHPSPTKRREILTSILHETERLSPPVIGLMRRVQHDIVIHASSNSDTKNSSDKTTNIPHPIQSGQDIWLYLPLACRDKSVFGPDATIFKWNRYLSSPLTATASAATTITANSTKPPSQPPPPLLFGTGPKTCIGTSLIRDIILTISEVMVDGGFELQPRSESEPNPEEIRQEAKDRVEVELDSRTNPNPQPNNDNNNHPEIPSNPAHLGRGVQAWLGWSDITTPTTTTNSPTSPSPSPSTSAPDIESEPDLDGNSGVTSAAAASTAAASTAGATGTTTTDTTTNIQRDIARELKQLPVQRPRREVWVGVVGVVGAGAG